MIADVEAKSIELREERGMHAQVLLQVGMDMPNQYHRNNRTFPAHTAFQSLPLVRDLLKLGLFCMNMPTMAQPQNGAGELGAAGIRAPEAILGVGFRYAISVMSAPSPGSFPILQIDDLERHVSRIEKVFGQIDVDMGLVHEVGRLARRASVEVEPRVQGV